MAAWIPTNFDEDCKRNAGRRKLHMCKRKARVDRIVRMLESTHPSAARELRRTKYGSLTPVSLTMAVSKATASRDFELTGIVKPLKLCGMDSTVR